MVVVALFLLILSYCGGPGPVPSQTVVVTAYYDDALTADGVAAIEADRAGATRDSHQEVKRAANSLSRSPVHPAR